MRPLIVSEFMTLDGVVEAPGGETTHPHAGWSIPFTSDEVIAAKLQETREAGTLLLGRRTFDQFAGAWPSRDGELADLMNGLPKTVVTSRAGDPGWNGERLPEPVRSSITTLKQGDGDPILVVGSASLVRALLVWGLVDELRLLVCPVMVGGGLRIFPDDREAWRFELARLQRFDAGAVLHTYRLTGG
ncbi:dihydrofolate reductase family protein [Leifsonia sp. AG29]|uniref:dihydrofolate reductase family protein n=1 Tax=Leifsonia sp. AG29 TaxID=2598860 RepID=UPI001E4AA3F6|nr:dihydrofolate reductase family protein [Leifsonia sp. AG29]